MSLANKTFKNVRSGQDITVIDQLGDFVILTNGGKVNITDLMDSNKYIESIDPNTFFSSHYDQFKDLADKIVNTPVNKDVIEITPPSYNNYNVSNEPAVFVSSQEDEMEELARKYQINNVSQTVSKQNEAFERILNPIKEEPITRKEVKVEFIEEKIQKMEDPIYHIFKNTKKSVDFKFSIEIDGKIPRLDFIEMMEDSYETSIIEFLSKEFTNKILSNPSIIEEQISNKIREMVFNSNKEINIKLEPTVKNETEQIIESEIKEPIKQKRTHTKKILKEESTEEK